MRFGIGLAKSDTESAGGRRRLSQFTGETHVETKRVFKAVALSAALVASGTASQAIAQQKTVKVGVLHSLSGTMAISETVLKDVALMAFEEINAKGGVMGTKIEPVVVDPASNWPLFAEKARQLLTQDKVAAVFGCWTSVSRKSVLPVFEELNGLLFYPVQYEGEELSKNVFYTGAAPNQQAIPAVEYLMSKEGGGAKRWVLLGTDYVYPRTTNKILRAFLKSKGVADKDIDEKYTPFGHSDYQTIVARHQEVRRRRQDRGGLDDQRRLERAVLQGARQPGPEGDRRAGGRVLGRRRGAARRRHQAAGRPPRRVELLHVAQERRRTTRSRRSGRPTPRRRSCPAPTSRSPTIRWKRPTSASTCGSRRSRRPRPSTSTR